MTASLVVRLKSQTFRKFTKGRAAIEQFSDDEWDALVVVVRDVVKSAWRATYSIPAHAVCIARILRLSNRVLYWRSSGVIMSTQTVNTDKLINSWSIYW